MIVDKLCRVTDWIQLRITDVQSGIKNMVGGPAASAALVLNKGQKIQCMI